MEDMNSGESKSKLLWWIIGIIIVFAIIGYGAMKFMGSDSAGSANAGSEELSASDLAEIPTTGNELIEQSITDDSDDVDFGEDLV